MCSNLEDFGTHESGVSLGIKFGLFRGDAWYTPTLG